MNHTAHRRQYTTPQAMTALALAAAWQAPARAQERATAPLPPGVAARQVTLRLSGRTFAETLRELSAQLGVSIVADGEPVKTRADLEFRGPGREALDAAADAFDYTWARGKSGVILMHKRFTAPEELPQLSHPEMRQTARDVYDLLKGVAPAAEDFSQYAALNALWDSLSAEQRRLLLTGTPLTPAQLNGAQREALRRAVLVNAFGLSHAPWERLAAHMEALPASLLQLRRYPYFHLKRAAQPLNSWPNSSVALQFEWEGRDRSGRTTGALLYDILIRPRDPATLVPIPLQPGGGR